MQYAVLFPNFIIVIGAFIYISKMKTAEGWLLFVGALFSFFSTLLFVFSEAYPILESFNISYEVMSWVGLFFHLLFALGFILTIVRLTDIHEMNSGLQKEH